MGDEFFGGNPEARRKLNEIRRDLDSLMRMTGDGFINVQRSPTGVTLSLSMNELRVRFMNFGGGGTIPRLAFSENAAAGNTDAFDCFLDVDTTGESVSVTPTVNTTGNFIDITSNVLLTKLSRC